MTKSVILLRQYSTVQRTEWLTACLRELGIRGGLDRHGAVAHRRGGEVGKARLPSHRFSRWAPAIAERVLDDGLRQVRARRRRAQRTSGECPSLASPQQPHSESHCSVFHNRLKTKQLLQTSHRQTEQLLVFRSFKNEIKINNTKTLWMSASQYRAEIHAVLSQSDKLQETT